jgi:hypothetical protein
MAGGKHTKMYGDLHSKLKSLADSGKINTPEGRKEASGHIDAIQNLVDKHLPGNPVPSKKTWLSEDQLEEASLAGLAPPFEKTTRKDVLVGRGVLKKHPTQPGKHVLAKKKQMEEAAGIQQPAPTATTNRPDRPSMGTQIGSTMRNSPVAGHAKQMMANQRPKPMMANQRAAGIQRPAPTATTNRPDRPSMGTQIGSTMRNSPVAGNARQMMANQRAKQMQEGDTTSPSAMGIKKPDYAPAGTTPAYAKSKEQTVNRAAKTSLPPGTVAKSIK